MTNDIQNDVGVLDFERPIVELESKINELRAVGSSNELELSSEITRLEENAQELTTKIFSNLSDWQISQLARHQKRPHFLDYAVNMFTDIHELHGDRMYAEDPAIVSGIARLNGEPVAFIGQQKGRTTKEKVLRNFGMPKPEGYRKALRVMKLAERMRLPILTFIDTPGAYPGIGAEERGQSEAIANNLLEMSQLDVPVVVTVIGEGGSGGALAIGVGDHVCILEYATYSVISPEGCASILWKDSSRAAEAASAMGITSQRLLELGLVDAIVKEPPGGAHRDLDKTSASLQDHISAELAKLKELASSELHERRVTRLASYGSFASG